MADDEPVLIPLRLETIRIAFMQLGDRVNTALQMQIGDRLRLQEQNSGVLRTLEAIQQHSDVIPIAEHQVMEDSINSMIQALSTATVQSQDLPSTRGILVAYQEATGQRGHPYIEVNYDFLSFGLELHGPTGLGPVAGVLSRTIRRRALVALDYGLVEPSAPVYTETADDATGEVVRTYTSSTSGPVSTISDGELDQLMHHILEIFPAFGRRMIAGHLRHLGHPILTSCIRDSCGIIIHAFIDGYSRYVTGIRGNDNNRAATILALCLEEVLQHGTPAALSACGYRLNTCCRSVHNIRIERLWCDVTRGFGRK
ncbi:hypothetical protein B0H17DRAFT_945306 [Mycena rosella]|uniref:Integrase core domain-containing protein n=1 Tax=Mycena rosella TaxID=1033263 RepID=A0AAD7D3U2_MYCRO|nr:hypothetical protein B0H17DRAFT_945306 [Mycena rosella]